MVKVRNVAETRVAVGLALNLSFKLKVAKGAGLFADQCECMCCPGGWPPMVA